MRRAIALAKKGEGRTSPNPCVGAVIVKRGKIIGEGYHRKAGAPHAEVEAINSASESTRGATMFVTLEPCVHYGRTPPCVEAIVKAGIKRVFIGTLDPNPIVNGKGKKILKEHGVEVVDGVLEEECRKLNLFYNKFISTGLPYVTLKMAVTLNGAVYVPGRRYISSSDALRYVHTLRKKYEAILVGSGTVKKDNPQLTVRLVKGRNPMRVVISNSLKISPDARVFNERSKTVLFTSVKDRARMKPFVAKGVEVIRARKGRYGVSISDVLRKLGKMGITSVLVEGGRRVFYSFLKAGAFDDLIVIVSPLIVGKGGLFLDKYDAVTPFPLKIVKIMKKGEDVIIIMKNVYRDNRKHR